MKKLLFVSTVPGTLRHFLLPFARHFRNLGWQVDAAARGVSTCPICAGAFNQVWDMPWSRNPIDFNNWYRAVPEIRSLIVREGYDLVHVHTPVASFVTRFALRHHHPSRRPALVYTAHGFHFHQGGSPLKNWFYRTIEKTAGRWTDYLITINDEDYCAAGQHGIVARERLKYMPGIGVDPDIYSPETIEAESISRFRQGLGVAADEQLFLVLGELNQNKRPELILEAFASLARPGVHLAYAGNGSMASRLRSRAEQLAIQPAIHLLGPRSDVPLLLAAADALILASRREGLPRSIMEALCMGKPCIGSDARGTRDMLADECGVIFRSDDRAGLSRAMAWVIDHPVDARKMAARGQKKMEHYTIRHILKLHEELYDEALAAS